MPAYKVRSGDTLFKIARRFGVPLDAIIELNRIRDPDRIAAGRVLDIPENSTDLMTPAPVPVEPPPEAPDLSSQPAINRTRFQLPAKEYLPEVQPKDLIVLHFTAGRSARSAFDTWAGHPARIATAYVVDPDGSIYELFDPAHWAFHLGVKGTSRHDRRSIGVEIANVGPLKPDPNDPDRLNWWPNDWGARWCRRDEHDKYIEAPFRTIRFFASMPAVQQDAVAQLVSYLRERFEIPGKLPAASKRVAYDRAYFSKFQGVAAHHNFRKDKWDVGPAFDWERLGI